MRKRNFERLIRRCRRPEEWLTVLRRLSPVDQTDVEGRTALVVSAQYGHFEGCKYLIEIGAPLNTLDEEKNTPLHCAIESFGVNHNFFQIMEVIDLLLPISNLHILNDQGESCLMVALRYEHTSEYVHQMLIRGAIIDTADVHGITPLMLAARNLHDEAVVLICARGGSVNALDHSGRNAFYHLLEPLRSTGYGIDFQLKARKSIEKIAEQLLEAGCDLFATDRISGNTSLHLAARGDWHELVRLMIAQSHPINQRNNEGQTPLIIAFKFQCVGTAQILVDAYADQDMQLEPELIQIVTNYEQLTAKVHPCQHLLPRTSLASSEDVTVDIENLLVRGNQEGLEKYLATVSDINRPLKNGKTLLILAIQKSSAAKVKILLNHHADVNYQDRYGKTALIHLMDDKYYGDDDRAKFDLLLSAKAINVNLQTNQGMTALMYACKQSLVEFYYIEQLLKHGADIQLSDRSGKTCFDFIHHHNVNLRDQILDFYQK